MIKLTDNQILTLEGGDWGTACGVAVGIGVVAAFASSPIGAVTWGFIGVSVAMACGAAIAYR